MGALIYAASGDIYIGGFKNGKPEGKGEIFNKDKVKIYEGSFDKGYKNGKSLSTISGVFYEGYFKYDNMNGIFKIF